MTSRDKAVMELKVVHKMIAEFLARGHGRSEKYYIWRVAPGVTLGNRFEDLSSAVRELRKMLEKNCG